MKYCVSLILLLFFVNPLHAQINLKDSTFSVVAYWKKHEQKTYLVTEEKIKIKDGDTISKGIINYEIEVFVKDSTAKSYTVDFTYHNFKTNSGNELVDKMTALSDGLTITFTTDEMGAFKDVLNWKEVRDTIKHALMVLQKQMKDIPDIDKVVNRFNSLYTDHDAVVNTCTKEIQQLMMFNGNKYKIGELYRSTGKRPNSFNNVLIEVNSEYELLQIDTSNNTGVVKYRQEFNKKQLTDASFEVYKRMASPEKKDALKREDMPEIDASEASASSIDSDSGWVLYSYFNRSSKVENTTNLETREMELK